MSWRSGPRSCGSSATPRSPTAGSTTAVDPSGRWLDEPGVGDCWGRALWGLGTAARRGPEAARPRCAPALRAQRRAPLAVDPLHGLRRPRGGRGAAGPPGPRRRPASCSRTRWRPSVRPARASPRPADGRGPSRACATPTPSSPRCSSWGATCSARTPSSPRVWRCSSGCSRSRPATVTCRSPPWTGGPSASPVPASTSSPSRRPRSRTPAPPRSGSRATSGGSTASNGPYAWFLGDNDTGVSLYDPSTGGSFDGLEADGRNANQGAESTLALISTRATRGAHRTTRPCLTASRRSRWPPARTTCAPTRDASSPTSSWPVTRCSPAESRARPLSWTACSPCPTTRCDDVMASVDRHVPRPPPPPRRGARRATTPPSPTASPATSTRRPPASSCSAPTSPRSTRSRPPRSSTRRSSATRTRTAWPPTRSASS